MLEEIPLPTKMRHPIVQQLRGVRGSQLKTGGVRTQKPPRLTYAQPSPEVIRGNRWHGQMGRPIARLLRGVRGGHTQKGGKKKGPSPVQSLDGGGASLTCGLHSRISHAETGHSLPHVRCESGVRISHAERRLRFPHVRCGLHSRISRAGEGHSFPHLCHSRE